MLPEDTTQTQFNEPPRESERDQLEQTIQEENEGLAAITISFKRQPVTFGHDLETVKKSRQFGLMAGEDSLADIELKWHQGEIISFGLNLMVDMSMSIAIRMCLEPWSATTVEDDGWEETMDVHAVNMPIDTDGMTLMQRPIQSVSFSRIWNANGDRFELTAVFGNEVVHDD
jgi:hypothetical protein